MAVGLGHYSCVISVCYKVKAFILTTNINTDAYAIILYIGRDCMGGFVGSPLQLAKTFFFALPLDFIVPNHGCIIHVVYILVFHVLTLSRFVQFIIITRKYLDVMDNGPIPFTLIYY